MPVVHPENLAKDLTMAQLKAIYMGEIKNWKEVGAARTRKSWWSRGTLPPELGEVWGGKGQRKKERVYAGALLQASSGAVGQAVSKNKYAIGYLGIGYVSKSVKAL